MFSVIFLYRLQTRTCGYTSTYVCRSRLEVGNGCNSGGFGLEMEMEVGLGKSGMDFGFSPRRNYREVSLCWSFNYILDIFFQ